MKKWLPLITVVFLVILSDASWSIENPAIRSPIVSGTAPPTSIRSGLIQSRNPIDTTGNLVITGNVIGGRHFRALVPYGSTTSFQAPVGSSSLDSFLRNSADLQDVGPYTDGYGPYYAPTGTVTIARPGRPGIFTPAMARIRTRAGSLQSGVSADELAMPGRQALSGLDTSAFQMSLRPMSRTPQELEKVISDELGGALPPHEALRYLRTERLPLTQSGSEQYQDGTGQFQHALKQNLTVEAVESVDGSLRGLRSGTLDTRFSPLDSREHRASSIEHQVIKRFETQLPQQQSGQLPAFPQTRPSLQRQPTFLLSQESTGGVLPSDRAELDKLIRAAEKKAKGFPRSGVPKVTPKQTDKQLHVYEQIKQRLDDLIKPDTPAASRLRSKPAGADERKGYEEPRSSILDTRKSILDEDRPPPRLAPLLPSEEGKGAGAGRSRIDPSSVALRRVEDQDRFTPLETPQAQDNLQKRKSLTGFNWYIKAAQVYLKQGRYYRAVDAYTMASIYKPGDPLAYVGKSQALFAAGEYIGSALFLSRALQILPGYASFKVDFVDILGDQDTLEKRIVDAEQRLKISDAAELQFLLGYIYYQLGRLNEAKNAIDAAYQEISQPVNQVTRYPDSLKAAVSAVKKAIDSAAAGIQPTIQ